MQRASHQPTPQATIELGEEFALRLQRIENYWGPSMALVCFQGYQCRWCSVPLGQDGTSQILISSNTKDQTHLDLPQDEQGIFAPLIEAKDPGHYHFALFTAPAKHAPKLPTDLQATEPKQMDQLFGVYGCKVLVK